MQQSTEIFISYFHTDKELLDKLTAHLSTLKREKVITAWNESEISAGNERTEEIEKRLKSARVILLLISSDFIASEENWQRDVMWAMERYEKKEARVIPVLLRDCDWENTPFGKLQPLPRKALPITSWQNQDEAFTDIAKGIRQAVQEVSRQTILNDPNKKFITKLFLLIPWLLLFKIFFTSSVATLLVTIMRGVGVFQSSELMFYDQMMRTQFFDKPDENLFIVEVTPNDIQQYGRPQKNQKYAIENIPKYGASLPDAVIHRLLKKLIDSGAGVIGFDIYRDFPAYNEELKDLFKDKRLVFICKVPDEDSNNKGYNPPPEIPEEQVGFSDFFFDSDGVIRRQLLQMEAIKAQNSKCGTQKTKYYMDSFAFKIAQKYLETKNNKYVISQKDNLLNDNRLPALDTAKQGGYRFLLNSQNLNGYTILLNYRNVEKQTNIANSSSVVNVNDILENRFNKELIKGKIVLIGVITESYDSTSPTPFSGGGEPQMWGLYIQAQKVSQLVSKALGERPLITVWQLENDMLWILVWAVLGAILSQVVQEPKKLIPLAGGCVLLLYGFCWILFMLPTKTWVPFTPTAAAFLGTGGILVLIDFQSQKAQQKSKSI
jgi:CHASE2 domain-containing sensor protein